MRYIDVGADISANGLYRYRLWRIWEYEKPKCTFVMLNPSTADGIVDDPTIRRCVSFAAREGCGMLEVVNLFAYRSTDPKNLLGYEDPVGPHNNEFIIESLSDADVSIVAWGSQGSYRNRDREVYNLMRPSYPFMCLGTTKNGHPRHPLYVANITQLQPWKIDG